MTAPTITRSELVDVTRRTIAEVRQSDIDISRSLERRLLHVARTTPRICRAWWNGSCGCLIGTLHIKTASRGDYGWIDRLSVAQDAIAVEFAAQLRPYDFVESIAVIEDGS